jgi:hypothetical protein
MGDVVPVAPVIAVLALQKGHDELVLGAEVPVQAGLGHA